MKNQLSVYKVKEFQGESEESFRNSHLSDIEKIVELINPYTKEKEFKMDTLKEIKRSVEEERNGKNYLFEKFEGFCKKNQLSWYNEIYTHFSGWTDKFEKVNEVFQSYFIGLIECPKSNALLESEKYSPDIIIQYGDQIKERINRDVIFSNFIEQSKLGLRKFVKSSEVLLECQYKLKNDYEIRDWEKIIMEIKFLDKNLIFEKKLMLWDQIDNEIRTSIKELIRTSEPNSSERIKNFDKDFFIIIRFA